MAIPWTDSDIPTAAISDEVKLAAGMALDVLRDLNLLKG